MLKRLKMKLFAWYWRRHPDKFIEKYFGIQLMDYQKKMLKAMVRSKDKYVWYQANKCDLFWLLWRLSNIKQSD